MQIFCTSYTDIDLEGTVWIRSHLWLKWAKVQITRITVSNILWDIWTGYGHASVFVTKMLSY